MQSEPSGGIKLTAYSCIYWLFHRIYDDARNHKRKIPRFLVDTLSKELNMKPAVFASIKNGAEHIKQTASK